MVSAQDTSEELPARRGAQSVLDLPEEILELILPFLSHTADVLNLSLTSKRFASLITPRYLQSRSVRAPLQNIKLWKRLAASPVVAARVTSLDVVCGPPILTYGGFLPTLIEDDDSASLHSDDSTMEYANPFGFASLSPANSVEEFERDSPLRESLVSAVNTMTGLVYFHWSEEWIIPSDELFAALSCECPSLRNVVVTLGLRMPWTHTRSPKILDLEDPNCSLWKFSNLHEFRFSAQSGGWHWLHATGPMTEMLVERCPDLEVLQLYTNAGHLDIASLVLRANWPRLKTLALDSFAHTSPSILRNVPQDTFNKFLARHAHVEHLRLWVQPSLDGSRARGGQPRLPSSMPNLRGLCMEPSFFRNRAIPKQILSQTEFLCSMPPGRLAYLPRVRGLKIHLGPMWRFQWPILLAKIARCVPNVERLHIVDANFAGPNLLPWQKIAKLAIRKDQSKMLRRLCKMLESLPNLTHLGGFFWVCYDEEEAKQKGVGVMLSSMAASCVTLRYVELRNRCWVEIQRYGYVYHGYVNAPAQSLAPGTIFDVRTPGTFDWAGFYAPPCGDTYKGRMRPCGGVWQDG